MQFNEARFNCYIVIYWPALSYILYFSFPLIKKTSFSISLISLKERWIGKHRLWSVSDGIRSNRYVNIRACSHVDLSRSTRDKRYRCAPVRRYCVYTYAFTCSQRSDLRARFSGIVYSKALSSHERIIIVENTRGYCTHALLNFDVSKIKRKYIIHMTINYMYVKYVIKKKKKC